MVVENFYLENDRITAFIALRILSLRGAVGTVQRLLTLGLQDAYYIQSSGTEVTVI